MNSIDGIRWRNFEQSPELRRIELDTTLRLDDLLYHPSQRNVGETVRIGVEIFPTTNVYRLGQYSKSYAAAKYEPP